MKTYDAKVINFTPFNEDVFQVTLKAPEGQPFDYKAGQYLLIKMGGEDTRPYSAATMPGDGSQLDMHIRNIPDNRFTTEVLERIANEKQLDIGLPCGKCTLARASQKRPLLFIAGGTGFAPFNAMINQTFSDNFEQEVHLYWGANTERELYLLDEVSAWSNSNFHFTPVVQSPTASWQHATGFVHEAAFEQHPDLADFDIFIGGSSAMVFHVYRQLRNKRVPASQIFSDMLDILRETGELSD